MLPPDEEIADVGATGGALGVSAAAERMAGRPADELEDGLADLLWGTGDLLRELLPDGPPDELGSADALSPGDVTSRGSSKSIQSSGSADSQAGEDDEEDKSKQGEASLNIAGPRASDRGEEVQEEGANGDTEPQGVGERQSRGPRS